MKETREGVENKKDNREGRQEVGHNVFSIHSQRDRCVLLVSIKALFQFDSY